MGFWMKSTIFQTFGTLRHPTEAYFKFVQKAKLSKPSLFLMTEEGRIAVAVI